MSAVEDRGGNADTVRFSQTLQSGCDVDALSIDVVALDDHVAQVDADAEPDLLVLGSGTPALRSAILR